MKKSATVSGAFVAALTLLAPQLAMAGEPVVQSIAVSYDDLDPSDTAGAKTLYARIRWAARKVCTLEGEVGRVALSRERTQCIRRAVDQAVVSINNPVLAAVYRAKNNRSET